MIRLAHLSDPHFGRIAHPEVVDALTTSVNQWDPDLIAISGDLTQRAQKKQFQRAARLIDRLKAPTLIVPGNHDVYPWWRPFARLFQPLQRYRRYISDDLLPVYESKGIAALGVNSAHGWLLKNGWIRDEHIQAIVSFFDHQPDSRYKVLVLHHHLVRLERFGAHDVARRASTALRALENSGVDLILCGHLHESHIEKIDGHPDAREVVVASAGTVTSNRGRGEDYGVNGYNVITVDKEVVTVTEKRYQPRRQEFFSYRTSQFDRSQVLAS